MGELKKTFFKIQEIAERCKSKAPKAQYKCMACRDTGVIIIENIDSQPTIIECECRKREKLKQSWINNGFSINSTMYLLSNFDGSANKIANKMKSMALEYIDNFEQIQFKKNNSISFLGQPGTGKTHLCTGIALELLKKGVKVIYFSYRKCINEIINLRMEGNSKYQSIIDRYKKSYVLYIDDLYKGGASNAELRIMFELIDERYKNNLPTIISSEFISIKLIEVDEAIGSRIVEMSQNRLLDIIGERYNKRLY